MLPKKGLVAISNIANAIFRPANWKEATVIMITKLNGDRTIYKLYYIDYPISIIKLIRSLYLSNRMIRVSVNCSLSAVRETEADVSTPMTHLLQTGHI